MGLGRITAVAVAIALQGSVFAASPAAAAAGGPPSGEPMQCHYDDYVVSCFEQDGDDFWVYDAEEDSASAVVKWWTDYGREGECRNSQGVVTWHECSYDMAEGHTVYWTHWTFDGSKGIWTYRSGTYHAPISS
jgi:hypothetical protein